MNNDWQEIGWRASTRASGIAHQSIKSEVNDEVNNTVFYSIRSKIDTSVRDAVLGVLYTKLILKTRLVSIF